MEPHIDKTVTSLSQVMLSDKPLSECEVALTAGSYRLYLLRSEKSFFAIALECVAWTDEQFARDDDDVRELFTVTAYFDGVRHLEFNRWAGEMAGYMYCPDMGDLCNLFEKVRSLEDEICDKE